ncbi:MAG: glycosyltransferase family 39 protein [Burkholderiales bacterium]
MSALPAVIWRLTPRWRLLLALLLLLPLLLRLGAAPLFDVDEGAFSEATREMFAHGDFGFTTLNGEPRFDKPILIYWLQALSVSMFGLHEWALRLPSVLAAWGWALAVVQFARPRLGEGVAWLAGVFTVTSVGVLAIGRAATADGLLNLLLALATLDAWRYLESVAAGVPRRAPLMRLYAWVGLGLLTKGPIAVLVPGAVSLLYCLSTRRFADWRRAVLDWRGWLLTLAIALPWYAYALQRHGQAFIDGFFVKHNLARYGGTLEGHGGSVGYYFVLLPLLLLPWSGLVALVIARMRTLWGEPLARYSLLWVGFVLVFFSFSGTKLPHYVLYGATPCFLLAAQQAVQLDRAPRWARVVALGGVLLLLALAAGLPSIMARLASTTSDPLYRTLLDGATSPSGGALRVAAVLAAVLFIAAWWVRRAMPQTPAVLALGCVMAALVVSGTLVPWLGQLLQAPVRQAGWAAREALKLPSAIPGRAAPALPAPGLPPIVQWGVRMPSFALYARAETPQWPGEQPLPAGVLALARADKLPAAHPYEILYAQRGYVLLRGVGAGR